MVGKLGPGYRTKRGAEMPDWGAVANLPSYKVRRTLQRWSIEVPRAIIPNRQRTMRSFYTAAGGRTAASQLGIATTTASGVAASLSRTAEAEVTGHHGTAPGPQRYTPPSAVSGASGPSALGTAVTAPSTLGVHRRSERWHGRRRQRGGTTGGGTELKRLGPTNSGRAYGASVDGQLLHAAEAQQQHHTE